MPKCERAIIMAAGRGDRLRPATDHTPKPLVKVNGVCMIDTIVHALHENGITEIYVVVGYLKEQYTAWAAQYPGVKLIENPWYDQCNNIASLYVARMHLENTFILDGDQLIRDSSILCPEMEQSGYSCTWTEPDTREWLLTLENGRVTHCSPSGGKCDWQLFSVSRWNKEDGHKLQKLLEYEFEVRKNTQIYWDNIALLEHPEDFDLTVYPIAPDALVEIDHFDELCAIDPTYQKLKAGNN